MGEHDEYDKLNRMVRGLFIGAALYTHANHGNTEKLRELLSEGTERIDYQAPDGETPAFTAAFNGRSDCLLILAENKANLDVPNNQNATPIFMAVHLKHKDCVQILIDHKVDVNQRAIVGTPLEIA